MWVSRARRRLESCLAAAARGGGKFRWLRAPGGELFVSSAESRHNSDCAPAQLLSRRGNRIQNDRRASATDPCATSLRRPRRLGRRLEPEFGFLGGSPHCFAPKAARAGCRTGANPRSPSPFCSALSHRALCQAALHLRRDRLHSAILVGRSSPRFGNPAWGWRPVGHKQASSHERHIAAAAGEQAEAPRVARAGAGQGAELERAAAGASRPPHDADDGRPGRRRAAVRRGGAARAARARRGRAAPGLIGLHSAILSQAPAL